MRQDDYDYIEFCETIETLSEKEIAWIKNLPRAETFKEEHTRKTTRDVALAACLEDYGIKPHKYVNPLEFPLFESQLITTGMTSQDVDWWIVGQGNASPFHVAAAVQAFLRRFRPAEVFLLRWGQRWDERVHEPLSRVGGGWCMVNKDEVIMRDVWGEANDALRHYRDCGPRLGRGNLR